MRGCTICGMLGFISSKAANPVSKGDDFAGASTVFYRSSDLKYSNMMRQDETYTSATSFSVAGIRTLVTFCSSDQSSSSGTS